MPDSASGESITRSSPKSFCSPSVIRKTPPSLPTSSPITRTLGSSSIARRRPALRALARVIWSVVPVDGLAHRRGPPRRCRGTPRKPAFCAASSLGLLGEDVVEDVEDVRVGHRAAALPQVHAELLGLGVDLVEERLVGQAVAGQVDLHPLDRVLELPALEVSREPVARRVVGRGVGAHPVGVGLHERRTLTLASALQRRLRDGVRREHVVAVDADAGEAEAESPLVERDPGLALDRLRDRPLVVLAEEDDRGVVGRGEDERLVDVALAAGAVTEVGDHGGVAVGVTGADVRRRAGRPSRSRSRAGSARR